MDISIGALIQEVKLKQYMNLAVSLAEAVYGQTGANPPVGAVIAKNGRVIGIGAHLKKEKITRNELL